MGLTLVTAPTPEPLTTDQAKSHLRVDTDDENTLIDTLIIAARQWVETFTHRALMTQTWDYQLDAFPCDTFELPLSPVISVTSVKYYDTAGVEQTWSSSNYQTDLPVGPKPQKARIQQVYGVIYPLTYCRMNAVTVRFVAGYGATPRDVPDTLVAAMKFLIGHWYENRIPVSLGNSIVSAIPLTVESMLWDYKAF